MKEAKKFIVIFLSIALVATMSGCDWFKSKEREAVEAALENFYAVTALNYDVSLKGNVESLDPAAGLFNVDVSVNGGLDQTDETASQFTLALNADFSNPTSSQAFALEFLMNKENIYFALLELSGLDEMFPPESVAEYVDKWWYMPFPKEMRITDQYYAESGNDPLSKVFKDNFYFDDIEYVGVSGEYDEYSAYLDSDAFMKFFKDLSEFGNQPVTDKDNEDLKSVLEALNVPVGIFIGKDDKILSKLVFSFKREISAEEGGIDLVLSMAFSNFNKPIVVTPPEKYEEFDPMMIMTLMGTMMSAAMQPTEQESGHIEIPVEPEDITVIR